MRNKLLFTIILGIFVISVWGSAFNASVIAQEQEHKDQPDHERQVQVQYDANQLQLESELKNGTVKDHISVEVQTHTNYPDDNASGRTEIRFVYTRENGTETSMRYNVDLLGLIEYKENGTQWGYQAGEKVAQYSIGGTGWNPITYSLDNSTGVAIHTFNLSTADSVVTILIHIASNVASDGNTTITPNALKIDILINNFPYTQTGDSLALLANVRSGSHLEHTNRTAEEDQGYTKNEQAYNMNVNGTTGYFSWADTVMADGVSANVIPSPVVVDQNATAEYEGEKTNAMTFSFNTTDASSIVWDPRIGVVTTDVAAAIAPATSVPVSSSTSVTSSIPATTPAPTSQEKSTSSSSPFMSFFLISTAFVILSVFVKKRSN